MRRLTVPQRPFRLAPILPLALLGLALSACMAGGQRFISSLVPVPESVAGEMGEFKYVTEQTGRDVHEIFRDEPELKRRGERHYDATVAAYNPVVEAIARSIESGEQPSLSHLTAEMQEAERRQQALIDFMDRNAGGNFLGLEGLLALASPWVSETIRDLASQTVRSYAAERFRSQFRLEPFEQL